MKLIIIICLDRQLSNLVVNHKINEILHLCTFAIIHVSVNVIAICYYIAYRTYTYTMYIKCISFFIHEVGDGSSKCMESPADTCAVVARNNDRTETGALSGK